MKREKEIPNYFTISEYEEKFLMVLPELTEKDKQMFDSQCKSLSRSVGKQTYSTVRGKLYYKDVLETIFFCHFCNLYNEDYKHILF